MARTKFFQNSSTRNAVFGFNHTLADLGVAFLLANRFHPIILLALYL